MNRNIGLDIIRSFAIILVLICHGITIFYNPKFNSQITSNFLENTSAVTGLFGVELFFILSGFLIGRILIKDILPAKSWSALKVFYIRRWFRTLPLYYLMVLGFFVVTGRTHYWENLIFIQNLNEEHLDKFPVSWSLSVEEWFYLLIPVLFIIARKVFNNEKKAFFIICFSIIFIELSARVGYTLMENPTFNQDIRKQVHFRLDSLMIGVLLAGINVYYKKTYDIIAKSKSLFIFSSLMLLAGLIYMFLINNDIDSSFFAKTSYFTLNSIFIAFVLAYFESSKRLNNINSKIFNKLIYIISITSYASYLIHVYIFRAISKFSFNHISNWIILLFIWLIAVTIVIFVSYLVYKYFEKPIMKYRDKITLDQPKNPEKESLAG